MSTCRASEPNTTTIFGVHAKYLFFKPTLWLYWFVSAVGEGVGRLCIVRDDEIGAVGGAEGDGEAEVAARGGGAQGRGAEEARVEPRQAGNSIAFFAPTESTPQSMLEEMSPQHKTGLHFLSARRLLLVSVCMILVEHMVGVGENHVKVGLRVD